MSFMDIDMYNGYNDYLDSMYNRNMDTAINNIIDQFTNHSIVNNPIEQITTSDTIGIPVVEGYCFQGYSRNNIRVRGYPCENISYSILEGVPVCEEVVVGRPVLWCTRGLD
jgi:hypothetical protein